MTVSGLALEADFTPEQLDRSRDRSRETAPLRLGAALLGVAAPCVLGFTPLGAALVRAAGGLGGGGWIATAALGAAALQAVLSLVGLPLSLALERSARRWGLSTRGGRLYAADSAKGFLIGALLLAGVSVGLYALVRARPADWWAVAAPTAAALVLLLSFLVPVLVEPLFNRFTPLSDGELRQRLLALVERSGVPVRDVLVADASRRTTAANAYVSGIGRTRRVVVWDTTIDRAEPGDVVAIAAHELGHAARRDVLTLTALGAAGAAGLVGLLALALRWDPLVHAAGVAGGASVTGGAAGDPRSLALVVAVVTLLGALTGPLANAFSRRIETRADRYALDLTRDPGTVVAMQRRLAVLNVADLRPRRSTVLLFGTHPPTAQRIAHARSWARAEGMPVPPGLS